MKKKKSIRRVIQTASHAYLGKSGVMAIMSTKEGAESVIKFLVKRVSKSNPKLPKTIDGYRVVLEESNDIVAF